MGTLQKRPNGSYTAKIRRKGFPALSATFSTKEQAETWMGQHEAKIIERITAARDVEHHKRIAAQCALEYRSFGDLMRRYLAGVTPQKRAADAEALRMRGLLKHSIAACPLQGLTAARIAKWRDERLSRVSGSTVTRDMNLLSHVVQIALAEWELDLKENPFHRVRRPRQGLSRERRLSPSEEVALMEACVSRIGVMEPGKIGVKAPLGRVRKRSFERGQAC
jgi:hypothetical protein